MSYVTLDEAKKHLAVFHSADDEIIQTYIDGAESYAASFMNRQAIDGPQVCPWIVSDGCDCDSSSSSSSSSSSTSSEPTAEVPKAVKVAILLLVGDYYENRTAGIVGSIYTKLPAAAAMLHMHRVGLGV